MYRRSTGGGASSLTLESVAFSGGRLTPSGAMLYVTDYLGTTFRDAYTGKEDQSQDFGARQYSPALCRWMTPDPLSEKYYGISPYAFCANNPLRYVDPDGRDGIYINFPDYVISVGNMQFENLCHSGILLINNQTGLTKY